MNKICTTIEQSKKLIELGIDVHTADMYYASIPVREWKDKNDIKQGIHLVFKEKIFVTEDVGIGEGDIPAWSLTALLGLMPKDESKTISLCLGGSNGMEHTFDWFCTCDENDEPYGYKTFHTNNPIDCTFEMIVWLKENNKL